jgi:hypothetical protein
MIGILGAAMTVAAYGQGLIHFSNYFGYTSPAYGINGQTAGVGNPGMGPSWSAQLLYFVGSTSDASQLTPLNYVNGGNTSIVPFGLGAATADGEAYSGWFDGGAVQIPGITADNASDVTFQILFLHNSVPTYLSTLFESAVSASSTVGTPNFASGAWQTAALTPVPEPTTFALAGLGIASMLIFRRRKA